MNWNHDRRYLTMAMPAAMEGVFLCLLSAADIIMVGALGVSAVAAVSIFTQPRMMILCLVRSSASALTLITANMYGAGEKREIPYVLRQSMLLALIIFALVHIGFYIYLEDILFWMGATTEYIEMAMEYGVLALIGVFFTSVASILQASLLGLGSTRAVMNYNVQGNIANVVFNYIFIFGLGPIPAMGVTGAGIATVLGTLWSLIITLRGMEKEDILNHWIKGSYLPTRKFCRAIAPVFGSVFSEQGFERIGMVLYTRMVAELGVLPYAVHAICMNFCDFYYSFAGGLGKASMVMAGHATGEKNPEKWRQSLYSGLRWSLIFSIISFVLTYWGRELIPSLYSGNAEVIALSSVIFIYVAAVSFPEAQSLVCAGILRGSGKTASVALYSLVSVAIFRPIITGFFLYELELGLAGAWMALAIDQSTRAACASFLVFRLYHGNKMKIGKS